MAKLRVCLMLLLIAVLASSPTASKQRQNDKGPGARILLPPADLPPDIRQWAGAKLRNATAANDTVVLGSYSFDTNGQPDPQGWVSVDKTEQIDAFFHVADASELTGGVFGGLVPLEGNQSMWCGVAPTTASPFCSWGSLPGYGHSWDQSLQTTDLACDSVVFSYKVHWSSEAGYDQTFVQYYDNASLGWIDLPVDGGAGYYEGAINPTITESFSFATTGGSTKLRFWFSSDGAWDDQDNLSPSDGAITVDSITVECYVGGIQQSVDYEDFESALPGDGSAGIWSASTPTPYGDLASLYPGVGVVQALSPCWQNLTTVWGFFDDPLITNYGCGGFPMQGAIPYVNADGVYMHNEVWSPQIALSGAGDEFVFEYSIYRDGPFSSQGGTSLVLPTWQVRTWVNGCAGSWRSTQLVPSVDFRGWARYRQPISGLVEPGATHIQVSLGVFDACPGWCWFSGPPDCHGHAPLYDDVRLIRVNKTGPQFSVRHEDLFQDNFAEDGTLTGTARADAAIDVTSRFSPPIIPGDSVAIWVSDESMGLKPDPLSGVGPAVYAYVAIWPENQPGKTGADLEAPETRSIGKRYPLVGTVVHDGVTWNCFRMDSALSTSGPVADRYVFDLNDAVITPGDTICYVFCAESNGGEIQYWSRRLDGQGEGFTTADIGEALNSPCEFTILPAGGWANGGTVLYVDAADDGIGPPQLFFDSAFDLLGIRGQVDRYDVLNPSAGERNTLSSRVKNISTQILGCYRTIIWGEGFSANAGDGSAGNDDFGLLMTLLDQGANDPGVYLTGDSFAQWWVQLGGSAQTLRSTYMNFDLANWSHIRAGEPTSPLLTATGPCFIHAGTPDQLIAFGGCPYIRNFDLLIPTGTAASEFGNTQTGESYVISQETPNNAGSTARVILSGFAFHTIRDATAEFPPARAEHLADILRWVRDVTPNPVGVDPELPAVAFLGDNYPNPFNPTTTIRYGVEERGPVSLRIYNTAGQLVKTLVDAEQTPQPGGFRVKWNGKSDSGTRVASGVYFYKLVAGNFRLTKKMVLLK